MSIDTEKHHIRLLQSENAELRVRLDEAEDTLRAIRTGEVDALVVGEQIYTLTSADAASNRVRGEMLAQVNDAVVAVDNHDHVIFLNAAAERQYGVNASDVLGHEVDRIYRCRWVHANDESVARETWSKTGTWRGENVHIKLDGEEITVESSVSRLTDGGGDFTGLLTVIRDITARKRAELEVRRLNEQLEGLVAERTERLEDVIRELDAFAFSISHDLRAPLRAMHGHATALIEDCAGSLDQMCRKYAERIISASERMDTLIQDLLAYSRLTREEVVLQRIELSRVLDEARIQAEDALRQSSAELKIDKPMPAVVGHRPVLVQAVTNLLTNAVKFVAAGVVPRVNVSTEQRDGHVRLWVEDNGIGIAPEHRERIFKMFERTA